MQIRVSAVIFDMDGVLIDTVELHFQSWRRLLAEEGMPFSREDNEKLRGLSREDSLAVLFDGRTLSKEKKQSLLARKNEYFLEKAARITQGDLAPGARSLLERLKRLGIKTAVASSSKNAGIILRNLGIADLLDAIIDGNSVEKAKPAPDLFLRAAEAVGAKPEECVVIEDASAGIEAARRAGMRVVGIGPEERVGQADLRRDSLARIEPGELLALQHGS